MENKFIATENCWYIIKSEESGVLYGKLLKDQVIETLFELETFSSKEEWETALIPHGVTLKPESPINIHGSGNPNTNPFILNSKRREKQLEDLKKSIK